MTASRVSPEGKSSILTPNEGERVTQLDARESVVLQRLAEGRTGKEIAAELQVSDRTVKTIAAELTEQFGATNRASLIYQAMKAGEIR